VARGVQLRFERAIRIDRRVHVTLGTGERKVRPWKRSVLNDDTAGDGMSRRADQLDARDVAISYFDSKRAHTGKQRRKEHQISARRHVSKFKGPIGRERNFQNSFQIRAHECRFHSFSPVRFGCYASADSSSDYILQLEIDVLDV
jgi:hypothetical protein